LDKTGNKKKLQRAKVKRGKLIIFSAPSGAGKTTIVKRLMEENPQLAFSVTATTRKKREHEVDGKDYYFISPGEFKKKIENGEFLEWEEVYKGQYYGTLKQEVERLLSEGKHVVFDVDVKGALNLKKIFGKDALAIFVMPPSLEELKRRLENRKTETEETLKKRISKAEYELTFAPEFDVIILNDDLEKAVAEAKKYIEQHINKE